MTLSRPNLNKMIFPSWLILLIILMIAGLVGGVIVFTQGLVVTNLSDLVPWGLWITIDLSAIALSAGAFMLSAAVYLLGIEKLKPVARTAVFVGMIGYTMAMMTLLMDLGRPDRAWHALRYWNIHSPLWEVTMCVVLYSTVLALEVVPIFGKADFMRLRWPRLSFQMTKVHRLAPILAVFGLGLSLLHQSSLGAAYGVLKARPIWYRPSLAVLFIVSAMVAGPAVTVLASKVAARLSPRARVNEDILDQISKFIGFALLAYLYLRFWDALAMTYTYEPGRTEGLQLLTQGPLAFNFWVGEILLGIIIPMIILLSSRLRKQPRLQMLALLLVIGGLVAYRWDINIVGFLVVSGMMPQDLTPRYTSYVPSFIEFVTVIGVIAYGLFAFTMGVRHLGVVDHEPSADEESLAEARPVITTGATD
jgi:Ni/Fe-hydrogenase subunit HybB-like protein